MLKYLCSICFLFLNTLCFAQSFGIPYTNMTQFYVFTESKKVYCDNEAIYLLCENNFDKIPTKEIKVRKFYQSDFDNLNLPRDFHEYPDSIIEIRANVNEDCNFPILIELPQEIESISCVHIDKSNYSNYVDFDSIWDQNNKINIHDLLGINYKIFTNDLETYEVLDLRFTINNSDHIIRYIILKKGSLVTREVRVF